MMDALQGGLVAGVVSALVFWGVVGLVWVWWKLKTRRWVMALETRRRVMAERWVAAGAAANQCVKRYAIFSGDEYDRRGGWGDFKMSGDDPDALVSDFVDCDGWRDDHWYEVVDLTKGEVVKGGGPRELRQERCSHVNIYMVGPATSADSSIMVSGAYAIPGKYCRDCGLMLEVTCV